MTMSTRLVNCLMSNESLFLGGRSPFDYGLGPHCKGRCPTNDQMFRALDWKEINKVPLIEWRMTNNMGWKTIKEIQEILQSKGYVAAHLNRQPTDRPSSWKHAGHIKCPHCLTLIQLGVHK